MSQVPYAMPVDGVTLNDVLAASEFLSGWCRTDLHLRARPFTLKWAGAGRWVGWWPLLEVAEWDEDPGDATTTLNGRVVHTPDLAGAPGDILTGTGTGGWGRLATAPDAPEPAGSVLHYDHGAYGYQDAEADEIVMVSGRASGTPRLWVPPVMLVYTVRTIARRMQAQPNQPGTMAYEEMQGPLTMGLTRQLNLYRVPEHLL